MVVQRPSVPFWFSALRSGKWDSTHRVNLHHPGPQALDWTARQKRIDQIAAAGKQVENKMFDTLKEGGGEKGVDIYRFRYMYMFYTLVNICTYLHVYIYIYT